MNGSMSERILGQARKYVLSYAFFRPESAIILALAIIGAGASMLNLPWFPGAWWMWLTGGALGEAAIVLSTLRDTKFYAYVADQLFKQQFDLRPLRVPELRQKVTKALEYWSLMIREIDRRDDAVLDDYLRDVARGMEDWVAQVYRLAETIDAYVTDPIIKRDTENVPQELVQYERLRAKADAALQPDVEKTVEIKRAQWDALRNLRDTISRAQLQLDDTLSAMGTVYMQTKLIGAKDVRGSRAQRLREEMIEQVRSLQDTTAAMEEIYQSRSGASSESRVAQAQSSLRAQTDARTESNSPQTNLRQQSR
jgi:hypothetical protein